MRTWFCWHLQLGLLWMLVSFGVFPNSSTGVAQAQEAILRGGLIHRFEAERQYGLTRVWMRELPLSLDEMVTDLFVDQDRLFMQSSLAHLWAIDFQQGDLLWEQTVGAPAGSLGPIGVSSSHLSMVNGSQLILLRAKDGKEVWSRRVVRSGGVRPGVGKDRVFFAYGNLLGSLPLQPQRGVLQPIRTNSSVGKLIGNPILTDRNVIWANTAGDIHFAALEGAGTVGYVHTGKTAAAPAHGANQVFLATLDGYLYALDDQTGLQQWRCSLGDGCFQNPVFAGERIFAVTESGALVAVDSMTGNILWEQPHCRQFLAASTDRVFYLDTFDGLRIAEIKTGKVSKRMPVHGIHRFVTNAWNDRLIFLSQDGLIQVYRDEKQVEPLDFVAIGEKLAAAKLRNRKGSPANADATSEAGAAEEDAAETTTDSATELDASNPAENQNSDAADAGAEEPAEAVDPADDAAAEPAADDAGTADEALEVDEEMSDADATDGEPAE